MTDSGINIFPAFSSPIVRLNLPNPEGLNQDLAALFKAREKEGERYRKKIVTPTTQVNIFESEFNLFAWSDAPVVYLRAFCLDSLRKAVIELNDYSPEQTQKLPQLRMHLDSWFHITRYGGYIGNHTHPMASWSGVYCVTPGETPKDRPQSGLLRFLDVRPHAAMYMDPGNVRLKQPFAIGSMDIRLVGGQLILFPAYLAHEVLPYFGRDERITVAFNCSFIQPGEANFGF
jgi:hypothetical protein